MAYQLDQGIFVTTAVVPELTEAQCERLEEARRLCDEHWLSGLRINVGAVAQAVDVWALLALARQDETVRKALGAYLLWGVSPIEDGAPSGGQQLYERVLSYVESSPRRTSWFASLMADTSLKPAFEHFSQSRRVDFDDFNARLHRFLAAARRFDEAQRTIAGIQSESYWTLAVYSLAGQLGFYAEHGDWDYIDLNESRPAFWAAFCRYAISNGVTPETKLAAGADVLRVADTTYDESRNFIDTVRWQLEDGCAETFLALHREHVMTQAIGVADAEAAGPSPRNRRTPL